MNFWPLHRWFKKEEDTDPLSFNALHRALQPEAQAVEDLKNSVDTNLACTAFVVRMIECVRSVADQVTSERRGILKQKENERDWQAARMPDTTAAEAQTLSEKTNSAASTSWIYDLRTPQLAERAESRQDAEIMLHAFKLQNRLERALPAKPPIWEAEKRIWNYFKMVVALLALLAGEMGLNMFFLKDDMEDKWRGSFMLSFCAIVPLSVVAIFGWPLVCRCLRHVAFLQKLVGVLLFIIFGAVLSSWINISTMTRGIVFVDLHEKHSSSNSGGADADEVNAAQGPSSKGPLQEALLRFSKEPLRCMIVPQIGEGSYYTPFIWLVYMAGVIFACREGNVIFGTPYWGYWERQRLVMEAQHQEQIAWNSCRSGIIDFTNEADDSLDALSQHTHDTLTHCMNLQHEMSVLAESHNHSIGVLPETARVLWRLYKNKFDQLHRAHGKTAPVFDPKLDGDAAFDLAFYKISPPSDEIWKVVATARKIEGAVDQGRIQIINDEIDRFNKLKEICGKMSGELAKRLEQITAELEKKLREKTKETGSGIKNK